MAKINSHINSTAVDMDKLNSEISVKKMIFENFIFDLGRLCSKKVENHKRSKKVKNGYGQNKYSHDEMSLLTADLLQ